MYGRRAHLCLPSTHPFHVHAIVSFVGAVADSVLSPAELPLRSQGRHYDSTLDLVLHDALSIIAVQQASSPQSVPKSIANPGRRSAKPHAIFLWHDRTLCPQQVSWSCLISHTIVAVYTVIRDTTADEEGRDLDKIEKEAYAVDWKALAYMKVTDDSSRRNRRGRPHVTRASKARRNKHVPFPTLNLNLAWQTERGKQNTSPPRRSISTLSDRQGGKIPRRSRLWKDIRTDWRIRQFSSPWYRSTCLQTVAYMPFAVLRNIREKAALPLAFDAQRTQSADGRSTNLGSLESRSLPFYIRIPMLPIARLWGCRAWDRIERVR